MPGWRNGIRKTLKMSGSKGRAGSTPAPGTKEASLNDGVFLFLRFWFSSSVSWLKAMTVRTKDSKIFKTIIRVNAVDMIEF